MSNGQADFFRTMLPYARRVSEQTGIDPRLVLAQSALETGFGRSAPNFNFFGIKAPQGQGASLMTSEFENGQMVQRNEPFRTYDSPAGSFEDYANLMLRAPRYRPVLEARTLEDQIAAMAGSGYATDPEYGSKLSQIASRINLDDPGLIASDAMAAIGRGPDVSGMTATERPRPAMNGQPTQPGLLAQGGAPQRPQRDIGNILDQLAIGFSGLSMRPNQGLVQMAQQRIGQRAQSQQETELANRTVEFLRQRGRDDLASAVESGALSGSDAARILFQPGEERGQILSAAQMREMFPGTQIEDGLYNLRPDGTANKVGGGGTTISIDQRSAGKFEEAFAAGDAATISDVYNAGLQAQRNLGRIDQLGQMLEAAPSGGVGVIKQIAGEFGVATEGLGELQAAQALINSLVPEQRQPGSGPMSDADLDLFKQSLPRIINQPGGNRQIIETMRAIAEYDRLGAAIIQRMRLPDDDPNKLNRGQAFQLLQERTNPLSNFRAPAGNAPAAGEPATGAPRVRTYNPQTDGLE